ncbi:hypothetical protein NWFMUON74_64160 [Nocardia wallacei]|uniref:Uncharacterized protein n=1 Tax=Nocardia wallacei TaxID=480035 RepID=A0A7G1KZW7_9NOCA|nr:hypothetical protein NWFMUON74_64160 [Nocardia wallacei]
MRCCASDSGSRSGRGWAVSGLRSPPPVGDSARAASAATVDASKISRTPSWVFSADDSRAATWVAISELPPSAKKSSSNPTRSRPSTSAKVPATISSTGVVGARKVAASNTGAGSARRSSLPEALSGSASSTSTTDGTMYAGSRCPRSSRRVSTSIEWPGAATT